VQFLSISGMSSTSAQTLSSLLKTIWRRFWRYSQAYVGFDRVNRIKLMFITTESYHVGETFMFDPLA